VKIPIGTRVVVRAGVHGGETGEAVARTKVGLVRVKRDNEHLPERERHMWLHESMLEPTQ